MGEDDQDITNLDDQYTNILQRRGWFLKTFYQSRKGGSGSTAYNNAMGKALKSERKVGLRSYINDNYTYWEVWEHC